MYISPLSLSRKSLPFIKNCETFENNLKWKRQICGKGGMISSLNQRLFLVKRLNQLSTNQLNKVADSIYTSKIRYGLPLQGKIRWSEEESEQADLSSLQVTQKSEPISSIKFSQIARPPLKRHN